MASFKQLYKVAARKMTREVDEVVVSTQLLDVKDRPKPPNKLIVRGPFVYRDHFLLLH